NNWTLEEKGSDDYLKRTTSLFMFDNTMVMYESETYEMIDYNSKGKSTGSSLKKLYSYWEPYSGTLPPPAWPTEICPEE
ncbi:MAG: hypothetical protein JXA18_14515, partial [Chitinispirillaceae bacterium]|nr:hypothetical protein [Chitinispirillaceae bacterium]